MDPRLKRSIVFEEFGVLLLDLDDLAQEVLMLWMGERAEAGRGKSVGGWIGQSMVRVMEGGHLSHEGARLGRFGDALGQKINLRGIERLG
jgi:hypothetical protein